MKKIAVLSALLLLAPLGMLFATGADESSDDMDGEEKITLSVFHYLDEADATTVTNFDRLREEFAKLHPDIEIDWEFLVNEPYHQKLQAMSVADQLPDVVFLWPGQRTGQVTGRGKVQDLRPWLRGHENEFAAAALAAQGSDGEIWELPEQVTATHVMFTNERLLDELGLTMPSTLEELIAQGDTIRNAGYIPIAMDNKDGWQMQSCLLSALVERTGGKEWILDAAAGDGAAFTDAEFVNALTVVYELSRNDMFSPGINQADYGNALTDFVNEKAVYFIDGGWRTSNLSNEMTPEQQEYVSLHVLPDVPNQKGQSGSTAIVAGTGFGINAKLSGKQADAAWEWVWFFSGPDGSKVKQEQGWLPAYKLPPKDDLPILQKKLAAFLGEAPGGYVIDWVMNAEAMGVLHPLLQEMMFENITPREAAREFETWIAANYR